MEVYVNWQLVEKHPHVIEDFVWTDIDYPGEVVVRAKAEGFNQGTGIVKV